MKVVISENAQLSGSVMIPQGVTNAYAYANSYSICVSGNLETRDAMIAFAATLSIFRTTEVFVYGTDNEIDLFKSIMKKQRRGLKKFLFHGPLLPTGDISGGK